VQLKIPEPLLDVMNPSNRVLGVLCRSSPVGFLARRCPSPISVKRPTPVARRFRGTNSKKKEGNPISWVGVWAENLLPACPIHSFPASCRPLPASLALRGRWQHGRHSGSPPRSVQAVRQRSTIVHAAPILGKVCRRLCMSLHQ
jgi:hypothetical protein